MRLHRTPRAGRVRALCSSARSKSCRRWSLRSAASGLTPSSHLPITIIDLGGGRERILGPRPDAGSLRLTPSGSFTSAFPNTTTQGGGMSPEGCSSLTLRCPERQRPLLESIWEIGTHHVLGLLVTVFSEGRGYTLLKAFQKGTGQRQGS